MMEIDLDRREYAAWYVYMTPQATPPEVMQRLNQAVNQVLGEPAMTERLRGFGTAPRHTTPAEALAFLQSQQPTFEIIPYAGRIEME